jgi:arsenate reductase
MSLILYHNPGCSKSRQALALLRNHGADPQIVEYLRTVPTVDQLKDLQRQLGLPLRAFLRDNEEAFLLAGLDDPRLDDEALLRAVVEHPILLQRPILSNGSRAVVGRPPEAVLDLLE